MDSFADLWSAPQPSEAPVDQCDDSGLLDLGGIRVPMIPGMQLTALSDTKGDISAFEFLISTASVQVSAYAAPRSGNLWRDSLPELTENLEAEGYRVEQLPKLRGLYAETDRARPLLIVGYLSDRWLLRAIFTDAAAQSAAAREPLLDFIGGIEVVRGQEAMPPGALIPLRLPANMDEEARE
ncbi:MAG: DUF3710 domain-containing protein [Varibaculum sp.]|nr:DUF3710 domain-containing protein [Varibaculum sp.]